MRISNPIKSQLMAAYKRMAREASYRPAAPSDGFGNITIDIDSLNLHEEAEAYAHSWWKEEDIGKFWTGCADFEMRESMVYAIEAARLCCAGTQTKNHARKLLQMARDVLPQ